MAMDRCLVVINLAMVVINPECLASLCQACNQACHQVCSPGCHHKIYNLNWTSAPWCGVLWRLQPLSKDSHWFWWWVTGRQLLFGQFLCYSDVLDSFLFFSPSEKGGWIIVPSSSKTWKHWNLGFHSMIYWVWGKNPRTQQEISNFGMVEELSKICPALFFQLSKTGELQQKQYTIVGWEFRFI